MTKLRPFSNPAIDRFTGYLKAAELAFIKGQVDVSLEASFFEIADDTVTGIEVVNEALKLTCAEA